MAAAAAGLGLAPGEAAAQLPPGEILNATFCCLQDGLGGVIRINPLTGDQAVLVGGIKEAAGVAVGAGGNVFVLADNSVVPQVIRVTPAGDQSVLVKILTATLVPGTQAAPVDLYVLLNLPLGGFLSVQLGGGIVGGLVPIATGIVPFPFQGEVFRHTLDGTAPSGVYRALGGATLPGTLNVLGVPNERFFSLHH